MYLSSSNLDFYRRYLKLRAYRKRHQLKKVRSRHLSPRPHEIRLVCVLRNESSQLGAFLEYYRNIGIKDFFFIDNESTDNTREILVEQPDVTLWSATGSYKAARYGIDWVNWVLMRYCAGVWVLVVDADELLLYPFCDERPLHAFTAYLDEIECPVFHANQVDVYGKEYFNHRKDIGVGGNLKTIWFDSFPYSTKADLRFQNPWVQGGVRQRHFFYDRLSESPALNKVPLVKWKSNYVYVSSTHNLLPTFLNRITPSAYSRFPWGALLHTKLIGAFSDKVDEEQQRQEHFNSSSEYEIYARHSSQLEWCECSEVYKNWRQLEVLGHISRGDWR